MALQTHPSRSSVRGPTVLDRAALWRLGTTESRHAVPREAFAGMLACSRKGPSRTMQLASIKHLAAAVCSQKQHAVRGARGDLRTDPALLRRLRAVHRRPAA